MKSLTSAIVSSLLICLASGCAVDATELEEVTETEQALGATWAGLLPHLGEDPAVVSRGIDKLDLFYRYDNKLYYRRYDAGWRSEQILGNPTNVAVGDVTAAVNGGRLDAFVVGSNNKIYHKYQTAGGTGTPTFSGWNTILNNPTVKAGTSIAVTSWGAGRLDLFWWTPWNNLGHAWATNNVWQGVETGDSGLSYLQPLGGNSGSELAAASTAAGRIDVVYMSDANRLGHTYYGATGWGRDRKQIWGVGHQTGLQFNGSAHISIINRGGSFDAYIIASPIGTSNSKIYRTTFFGSWDAMPNGAILFSPYTVPGSLPLTVDSGVTWSGRNFLFGTGNSTEGNMHIWQSYD